MAITARLSVDGKTMTITLAERFDFHLHQELRQVYEQHGKCCSSFVIDLRETRYIDSSALGMLLQLREYAGGGNSVVTIQNAEKNICDILKIANFDKLMTVES